MYHCGWYFPFLATVSCSGQTTGGGAVVVGVKRAREKTEGEPEKTQRGTEEAGEDPYGGSTDEAEDMEVDVGMEIKDKCIICMCICTRESDII